MTDTPSRDSSGRFASAQPEAGRDSTTASSSNKALVGLLLAGLAGLTVFLFVSLSGDGTASAKTCHVGERDCLPDVSYVDTMGTAYTPQSLANKVVIVNFWATWCKPCEKEIPDLSKVYDEYKDRGLVILGVLSNDHPDNQQLLNFQSDHLMSYPVVRDSPEIQASYGFPQNLPTTFIYDRRGKRMHSHVGLLRAEQLTKIVEPLLAKP